MVKGGNTNFKHDNCVTPNDYHAYPLPLSTRLLFKCIVQDNV